MVFFTILGGLATTLWTASKHSRIVNDIVSGTAKGYKIIKLCSGKATQLQVQQVEHDPPIYVGNSIVKVPIGGGSVSKYISVANYLTSPVYTGVIKGFSIDHSKWNTQYINTEKQREKVIRELGEIKINLPLSFRFKHYDIVDGDILLIHNNEDFYLSQNGLSELVSEYIYSPNLRIDIAMLTGIFIDVTGLIIYFCV